MAGCLVLLLLVRLPFLAPGFGTDTDAWRTALAARELALTGVYHPSRLPGYPVHEALCALLSGGGPLALNGATCFVSLIAAGCLGVFLRRLGIAGWHLGMLAYGLTPVVLVNSVVTMDYLWAQAMVLAALLALQGGRPLMAGALLGLAAGCRLTSLAMVAPACFYLWCAPSPHGRWRSAALLLAGTAATALLCYAPLLQQLGLGFLTYYDTGYPGWPDLLARSTRDVLGVPGTVALLWVALAPGARIRRESVDQAWFRPCLLGVGLTLVAYLRLPYEAGYLLPAIPLTIVLLGLRLESRRLAALAVALGVASFALGLRTRADSPSRWADLLRGPVLFEDAVRRHRGQVSERLIAASLAQSEPAVLVAGAWEPLLRWSHPEGRIGQVRLAYQLSAAQVRQLRTEGLAVFFAPQQRRQVIQGRRDDLSAVGGRPLLPEE